jgi:hypothetical protein
MTDKSSLPFNYPTTIVMTGAWAPTNNTSLQGLAFSDYTNYLSTPCISMLEQFQDFRILEVRARIVFPTDDTGTVVRVGFSESELAYSTSALADMPGTLVLIPSYKATQRLTTKWVAKSFGDLTFWPVPVVVSPVPVYLYYAASSVLTTAAFFQLTLIVQVRGISSWNSSPTLTQLFKSVEAFDEFKRVHIGRKSLSEVGK